jgi:hypothetical protein
VAIWSCSTFAGQRFLRETSTSRSRGNRQPLAVVAALDRALDRFEVATAGLTQVGRLIDHIAVTSGLRAGSATTWPQTETHSGLRLSDHCGVVCDIAASP